MSKSFLPTCIEEGKAYYPVFEQFDVIFVTGDPYYDHPLSGIAILSRLLDRKGYKIGIIAQPEKEEDYRACGTPLYFFCITSGLLDSMLANYSPMLRKRENILVPEHAPVVYTQKIKAQFKQSMTVLGGVEATIRRFTHFDYKENSLRRGILNDSKADLILHGNAERSLLNLLSRLKESLSQADAISKDAKDKEKHILFQKIKSSLVLETINGISFRIRKEEVTPQMRMLPTFEECKSDKKKFSQLTRIQYLLPDSMFIERCGDGYVRHNRPDHPLTEEEMDYVYESPFTRKIHPESKNLSFHEEMVEKLKTSVPIGRGCWGSCTFCVIPLVQGKEVARRSVKGIIKEIEMLYKDGNKVINDLTLPTLNMYGSYCRLYDEREAVRSPVIDAEITVYNKKKYCNQQCVGCKERILRDDLYPLLLEVEKLQKKHDNARLELRSAIRHDIILDQPKLFRKIMQFVTRLKIAPEHISDKVLRQMNKATRRDFERFLEEYKKINQEQGTHKNLVPYFVAAHPGCTADDMKLLRKFCEEHELYVNLTQVFTPTPGTAATASYYSGEDIFTKKEVYVPRSFREKKLQKNILFFGSDEDPASGDDSG